MVILQLKYFFMKLIQIHITEILILLFLIVTFLQSGIDKVSDWEGNLTFIKSHFKSSPLKNFVGPLLAIILFLELMAGALMLVGVFQLATTGQTNLALLGVELAALCLVFLLIGQRLAKDYAGAMTLAVYFMITIFGVYLLNR